MRDQFIKTLTEIAEQNDNIMLITGDLGFGVLTEFAERFPDKFLNAGVAEQLMTGLAAGMAMEGKTVFTYSIGNFATLRCLEQIRNDVCYHELNVNITAIGGGFSYGGLGISHHATEDLAIMRAIPNMTVITPCDDWETDKAVKALVEINSPSYLRLDRRSTVDTSNCDKEFIIGKARTIKDGSDLTIISCGNTMSEALLASDILEKNNISAKILSMHTLKPFDTEAVFSAAKETDNIFTVEEHVIEGGLGGTVAETLLESGINPRSFYRFGLRSGFASLVGNQEYLRKQYKMDGHSIASKIMEILK